MPPVQATATATAIPHTRRRFDAIRILGQIALMALPLMAGAVIMSALNLGKIAILAHTGQIDALDVFSLLQPAFIFVLAVMEGLAITNQVFSARSVRNWPRRGITGASARLSALGLAILFTVAAGAYWLGQATQFENAAIETTMKHLPAYLLSMSVFMVFDVYFGAMRGQGRLVRSLVPFAALAAIDLAVTYGLIVHRGWGFEAILAGNLIAPLVILPVMLLLVYREAGNGPLVPNAQMRARLAQLLMVVGAPLALSIVAGAVSAAVIFPALASFGKDYASGFLVVLRFRIAFMIPAIAFGSVIAILINQADENGSPADRARYLMIGLPALLAAYAVLTAAIPYFSAPMLDLLLSQRDAGESLRATTETILIQLQVTFFLVAGAAMLQVMLEQLGRAAHVLVITILTETATCGAVLYAIQQGAEATVVMMLLNLVAGAAFLLLLVQIYLLARQLRVRHAV